MIVRAPEQRWPAAPEGTHVAVCVDEIDIGEVTTTWNGEPNTRHMVRLVWQIDEQDADGHRFLVKQDYTASLDEKAKLRKHLEAWRGRKFTSLELAAFDLETVVSACCMLQVEHNAGRKGGVFANVVGVMKLLKGTPPISVEGYVRVKDRPVAPAVKPEARLQPRMEEAPPVDWGGVSDDDVPF